MVQALDDSPRIKYQAFSSKHITSDNETLFNILTALVSGNRGNSKPEYLDANGGTFIRKTSNNDIEFIYYDEETNTETIVLSVNAVSNSAATPNRIFSFVQPKVAAIGDSFVANDFADGQSKFFPLQVARSRMNLRFDYSNVHNFAASGARSDDIYLQTASAIAVKPDIIVVSSGFNDVANSEFSVETTANNISETANVILSNGILPIICTLPPRSSAGWTTTGQRDKWVAINNRIKQLGREQKGIIVCDWTKFNIDYNSDIGVVRDRLTNDGVHPTAEGAWYMSEALIDVFNSLIINSEYILPTTNKDVYDSSNNNINSTITIDPLLIGSAGDPSTNFTGTLANCMRGSGSTNTSTIGTKTNRPGLYNGQQQQLEVNVVSGSGTVDVNIDMYNGSGIDITDSALVAGVNVRSYIQFELSSWDSWAGLYITCSQIDDTVYGLYVPSNTRFLPNNVNIPLTIESPTLTLANTQPIRSRFKITCNRAAVTGNGTCTISKFGIKIVED